MDRIFCVKIYYYILNLYKTICDVKALEKLAVSSANKVFVTIANKVLPSYLFSYLKEY